MARDSGLNDKGNNGEDLTGGWYDGKDSKNLNDWRHLGANCIQIFIWGGISSDIRSEFSFYTISERTVYTVYTAICLP